MNIAVATDHRGYQLKEIIKATLIEQGHHLEDVGVYDRKPVDYPLYGEKAARLVAAGQVDRAIVICGSGIGISIAANKVRGVRAALCSEPLSAALCRRHNDANVLALGADMIGEKMALEIVGIFLVTDFAGDRHEARLAQIAAIEERS